jgi:putative tricarboxylic transport membrane protein
VTAFATRTEGVVAQRAATPRGRFPLGPSIAGVVLVVVGAMLLWSAVSGATAEQADNSLRGPWIAPLAVSTAWLALSVAYLVLQIVAWLKRPSTAPAATGQPTPGAAVAGAGPTSAAVGETDDTAPQGAESEEDGHVRWVALALLIIAIFGFTLLLKPLGFVVAGAAFMMVSVKIFGSPWPGNLLRDAIVAVLLPFAVYLLIKEGLGIGLAQGVLQINLRDGQFYFLPPTWEWPW